MNDQIILFVDMVGRTLMGKLKEFEGTDEYIVVENPAIVHIQPTKPGQLQVQVIPYLIPEFVAASKRRDAIAWKFPKNAVFLPVDIEVDTQLLTQYNRIFSPIIQAPVDAPVINLFDDKK